MADTPSPSPDAALLTAVAAETVHLANLFDRDMVYQAIADAAERLFQASATLLLVWQEASQQYQVVANKGCLSNWGELAYLLNLSRSTVDSLIKKDGPVAFAPANLLAEPGLLFFDNGVNNLVFTFLSNGAEPIGVLWLGDQHRDVLFRKGQQPALELFGRHAAAALQRIEFFAQGQVQIQEMAVLSAIQHSLMSALGPEQILHEIVLQIQYFLRVDSCSVFLYNEISNQLDLAISADPALAGKTISFPVDRGIAGRTMRTRRPVLVNNTAQDAEYQGGVEGSALQIKAMLCAPLLYQDEVLGVIQALSSRAEAFTESHLNLLASAASAAAIALQNARLHDRLVRRVAELDALSRSGWAVAAAGELDETLKAIVVGASGIPGVDWANILLYDPQIEHFFQTISSRGPDGPIIIPHSNARSTGLSQHILTSGQSVLINNTGNDERISPTVRRLGIEATIGVPVMVGATPVGVIYANSRRPHVFDEEHITVFNTLATQAAVAIQRARLVENVRHSEQQLQAILNSTDDGIIATTADGMIQLLNPAAEQLLGYQSAAVTGRPVASLFNKGPLAEALAADPSEAGATIEIGLDDGRTLLASLTSIHDPADNLLGRVVTMRDISYLKELDDMKNEFVSTVSHDLKNPITAIVGFADLMTKMGELNNPQRKALQRIEDAAQRMLRLVTDLLDLGRIEAGVALNKTSCDLSAITEQTLAQLENEAAVKNILLARVIDTAVNVVGDPERLQQVINNLIHNAIKYTPDQGQVCVTVSGNRDYANLVVEDSGYGIPPADLPYIFDKFYRVPTHKAQGIEGTGLGLAIVKAIIEQHQGHIQVKSENGRGTTFLVELPYQF